MLKEKEFAEKVQNLRDEVMSMSGIDDPEVIAGTAARLKVLNYAPPVGADRDTFLSFTTAGLVEEIDRLAGLSEEEVLPGQKAGEGPWDSRLQHISVLVFYFRELAQLRRGVPESWDEVDELYVHD